VTEAGKHEALHSASIRRWTLWRWTLAVSAVLIAVFVAIGTIQTRQIKQLDKSISYNEENVSWVFFQLEREYMRLAESLRQAERYPQTIKPEVLRERYEIFVSRFLLMQSMRMSTFVTPLPKQVLTAKLIEPVISQADPFMSENSQAALTPDVINQLLARLEPLEEPIHDLTGQIAQLMLTTVTQRSAAARNQVYIGIALNIFQGLLVLGFAALLIRQVDSLEKRSVELRQATDEIRLLNSELEKRVSRRTAQLEASNQELEAFSYSVSHDLRAPLKTINGFSHLLERTLIGNVGEKGQHYLNRIRAGTRQMGELIDGLLSLAQLSRDKLQLSEVNLADIARSICKECRERDPERQAQILVQEPMRAMGDQRLLSVVLQNLIGNAWKFTSRVEMARIEVGSQPQDAGETVYFVKDNGAGFDMAYADKLFGTFQRLHSPGDFAGTGIGLATVKRVIDRHGGRIWAQSKEGVGAVFFFTLGTAKSQYRDFIHSGGEHHLAGAPFEG
jgi:signal transduction histidine kinase